MAIFGSKGRRIEIDLVANDKASPVFNTVGNSMSTMSGRLNSGINSFTSGLHRYNNAMSSMYRSTQVAMVASGYLVYNFTKDAMKNFSEFERQHGKTMGAIASNYDRTTEAQKKFLSDQKQLREESIKLGTVGPTGKGSLYNPTEVSYAQTALAKSGVKVNEISNVLPQVLKFAGGNDLNIETASDYAVNLANMFNIKQDEWGKALDMITRSADISTIDVADIFESLKYAGPIASALKRPLQDVLAMLSVMGNSGLKGSVAGTGIQAFMTRILNPVGVNEKALQSAPTQNVANVLEQFVKQTTDQNGKFNSMVDITGKLDETMNNLTDKEKAWFSYKLFGLFQMKAGYTLSKNGGSTLEGVINDIANNSKGTNDRKWDIMMNTSYGRQEAWTNAVSGVKTDIGGRLAPFTNEIYDQLFQVLSNKGNYDIDFTKLKSALNEAGNLIGEQYGEQLGTFVKNAGNLALDGSRVAYANEPILEGLASGITSMMGGDFIGGFKDIKDSVSEANDRIKDLPPELQIMAEQVKNAGLALATLAGVNFAAKLLENLATIYKYTLGKIVAQKMNVVATSVVIQDTGVLDKNGNPIYKKSTVETTGTGKGKGTGSGTGGIGGGTILLDKDGKKISSSSSKGTGPKTIVDVNGAPITSAPVASKGSTFGQKLGKGLNTGMMVYSIGEFTGINDMLLNKVGATEGTKSRAGIDTARTWLNYGMMASFVDSLLLKGAGKALGKQLVTQVVKGIPPAIQSSGSTIMTAVRTGMSGGLTAGAVTGAAVPLVVAAGTAVALKDAYDYGHLYGKNKAIMDKANEEGRPTYLSGDKYVTTGWTPAEQRARVDEAQYHFGGTVGGDGVAFRQAKPNKYLHPFKYKQWQEGEAKTNTAVAEQRKLWDYAKNQYQAQTGGAQLTWDSFTKNKAKWEQQFNDSVQGIIDPLERLKRGLSLVSPQTPVAKPMPTPMDALTAGPKYNKDGSQMSSAQVLEQMLVQWKKDNQGTAVAIANGNANLVSSFTSKFGETNAKVDKVGESTNTVKSYIVGDGGKKTPDFTPKLFNGQTLNEFMTGTLLNQYKNGQVEKISGSADFGTKFDTLNSSIVGVQAGQAPIANTLNSLLGVAATDGTVSTGLNNVNSSVIALQNQPPPTVNVAPPQVSVNVKVDKEGNVVKNTYITTDQGNILDKIWAQSQARFGK